MRKILLSTVALAALTGYAMAGDLPSTKEAPVFVAPPPVFTWTGFYVGANDGYGGDEFRYPIAITGPRGVTAFTGTGHLTSGGFIGGGQIGYNYQFNGPFVIGAEADIMGTSITGEVGLNGTIPAGAMGNNTATTIGLKTGSQLDYLGTVRGRLGYALLNNRGLLYVTGGFAYGGVHTYFNANVNGAPIGAPLSSTSYSKDTTPTGWTVGGGFEYAITDHWTFRGEYLYADLGSTNLYNSTLFGAVGTNAHVNVDTTVNIIRVGVNYKFGGLEPAPMVAAKY